MVYSRKSVEKIKDIKSLKFQTLSEKNVQFLQHTEKNVQNNELLEVATFNYHLCYVMELAAPPASKANADDRSHEILKHHCSSSREQNPFHTDEETINPSKVD
ncbi:hypothetical protein M514_02133 [Trichuris suis]|uniref:Uncharacterized protein n=1 Tax=Trichuris suis TaxID=68888 RepID=A0A085MI30_9BILA|nr:hypothetical protein M513_02133 [Trichuris suis]KFD61696.1 hypothetical protein M514_02133 [Trichuris suis]